MKNKIFLYFFLIIVVLIGFYLRIFGLSANYPFWIDEFSSGQAAAAIAQTGSPKTITGAFEARNLLNHYLMGASMKIFGINEFAARFPSVIWGTLMILAAYLVFSKIFSRKVGLATVMLTVFSVIEITWSRQARGYALFQLLYLTAFYFFWKLVIKIQDNKSISLFDVFVAILFFVLSLLSHLLGIILILSLFFYLFVFERKKIIRIVRNLNVQKKIFFILFFLCAIVIFWFSGLGLITKEIFILKTFTFKIYNNFWYYHSFLWRQYPLIVFLSVLGAAVIVFRKERKYYFLLTAVILQIVLPILFFKWLDTRYLYSVFPIFFFALLAYFLDRASVVFSNKSRLIKLLFMPILILFIIGNGHKFSIKPRAFYSPNADMREIPLADYNLVYGKIKAEIAREGSSVVVIDTWIDKIAWYLGRDYPKAFWIRSKSEVGKDYIEQKGKIFDKYFRYEGIFSKDDLLGVIKDNKKGFILIDGHEVPFIPKDALSYIEDNLKVEMKLDRFSLDPDPYDTWPVTLYSWGI